MRTLAGWTAVCVIMAGLAGCSTEKHPEAQRAVDAYYFGNFPEARNRLRPLAAKTDEDYVLNNVRLGTSALADYDLVEAEKAFYKAYEVMNAGGVNNASRSAAAIMLSEKLKVWKGEPYERAMANFYLGLVYYMRKDHANARAAFENCLFKLRDYTGKSDKYKELESDFVLAYIMLAKCWQWLDDPDKAADLFATAAKLRPHVRDLVAEARQPNNVLLVVDFGTGPRKRTKYDNSIVTIEPKPSQVPPLPRPNVLVNGRAYDLRGADVPSIDLLDLAQERRWQSMDTIRLAKSAIGTGMMGYGAYQGIKHENYGTAAALIGLGALLKATATADVRHWEMLPRTVYVLPLHLKPGRHDITVSFGGGLQQTWRGIIAPEKGEETYYIRITRFSHGPFTWPPPSMGGQVAGSQKISRTE